MRVLRGRESDLAADRAATAELLDAIAADGEPALRVWAPHRQVAFGRRDARGDGFERARELATERGFQPVERRVGGRAVAYTGRTLAFAHATPLSDARSGLDDRYESAVERVLTALREVGAAVERGEPADTFCPGEHSIRGVARNPATNSARTTGKICGIAQRIQQNAALVSGCVIVRDHAELADVLDPIYDVLGVPFDPETVGSVAAAGGPTDPRRIARAVETALLDGAEPRTEALSEPSPTVDPDV